MDSVLPEIPYRQFVITFPKWLRIHLAINHSLNDRVIRIAVREIHRWQRRRARALGYRETRTAAIAFQQHLGSALQLNPHGHLLIPEGVFGPRFANAPDEPPAFIRIAPPSDEEVESSTPSSARSSPSPTSSASASARSMTNRSPSRAPSPCPFPNRPPSAGRPPAAPPSSEDSPSTPTPYCREDDRASLERLCRYALRPPLSLDRMSAEPDGRIRYRMKRALPDGSQDLILTRPELLRRLASLVPPPRKHLTRYFGLFAPAARDRANLRPRPSDRPPVRTPHTPRLPPPTRPSPPHPQPTRPRRLLPRAHPAPPAPRASSAGPPAPRLGHRRLHLPRLSAATAASSPPSPIPTPPAASSPT